MKLLLDEMWSPAIAAELRARGHDVEAAVARPDLAGAGDRGLFAAARVEGRVIVTADPGDFRLLAAEALARGERHAGLIFASSRAFPRSNRGHIGQMVTALDAVMRADPPIENGELWLRPAEL